MGKTPGIAADPESVLRSVFGYTGFRPLQREVMERVIGGGDAFVLMPTGGGKSLCYQVPALVRPGTAVVVSPLISLMKDQVDALRANGVAAERYDSSLEAGDAWQVRPTNHRRRLASVVGILALSPIAPSSPSRYTSLDFRCRSMPQFSTIGLSSSWAFEPE